MLQIDDCSRTILLYHAAVEQISDFLGKCDRGDNTYDIHLIPCGLARTRFNCNEQM